MIELLVLDVDGCMSDGSIIYTDQGHELKAFNVKDGFAIVQWHRLGKRSAIITGRKSPIVAQRAKELGIDYLRQNVKRKDEALQEILNELSLTWKNVAAIGDDLNDYRLLQKVGLSFAPLDAIDIIKQNVDVILTKSGGRGAVREMIEIILQREDLLDKYLDFWMK
ncbi:HAD family hydrolase [Nitratiruptor sp. YY09-18]|uniref:KdsC family phosphatase n=1 Tax=Nitratiruptor sp. YY09-18 TaxID=2724901 RepID=UPI00191534AF|nr:HAD hydrolase family protein [Nitratiruptor sp. YY09-18]BCD67994.1 3-deoxy-D-manno-octulosonate 8-phosphate phosphatase (KDO 8-P phosphatase) [Nitratiruptor sp. YY09-18]